MSSLSKSRRRVAATATLELCAVTCERSNIIGITQFSDFFVAQIMHALRSLRMRLVSPHLGLSLDVGGQQLASGHIVCQNNC